MHLEIGVLKELAARRELTGQIQTMVSEIVQSQSTEAAKGLLKLLDVCCADIWWSVRIEQPQKVKTVTEEFADCKTFQKVAEHISQRMEQGQELLREGENSHYSPAVIRAVEYMRLHLEDKQISIEQIADAVALSASRFRKIFKEETGRSPLQYLGELRFQRAERLLVETCMKMDDIADQVGFLDGKYFRKVFQNKYQMTPREFRECRGKRNEGI